MNIQAEICKLTERIEMLEFLLAGDKLLVEDIRDYEYQEYTRFAKAAGTDKEKAKYHQKAGMRAAALGYARRGERHLNLSGAYLQRHMAGTAPSVARQRRAELLKQQPQKFQYKS